MQRSTERYPIRAVARITRLSVDSLRAWERRYEAVVPERDHCGRVYSDADINRLKQLAILVERGHAIGNIASLSTHDLTSLIDGADALAATGPDQVPAADLTRLRRALDLYDLTALESALARHAAVLPARELVFAVILPLLREQEAALIRDIGFGQRVDTLEELLTMPARVPRAGA